MDLTTPSGSQKKPLQESQARVSARFAPKPRCTRNPPSGVLGRTGT
jgi:hypothetical protein